MAGWGKRVTPSRKSQERATCAYRKSRPQRANRQSAPMLFARLVHDTESIIMNILDPAFRRKTTQTEDVNAWRKLDRRKGDNQVFSPCWSKLHSEVVELPEHLMVHCLQRGLVTGVIGFNGFMLKTNHIRAPGDSQDVARIPAHWQWRKNER